MSERSDEDEGQERKPQRRDDSRPVTAAARRQRRASARKAAEGSDAELATPIEDTDTAAPTTRRKGKAETEKKGRPTPARDGEKAERPSFFARVARFLREVVAELRKVIWPTRKQMITYTSVVLVFLVVMTALVFGLDAGLARLMFLVFA